MQGYQNRLPDVVYYIWNVLIIGIYCIKEYTPYNNFCIIPNSQTNVKVIPDRNIIEFVLYKNIFLLSRAHSYIGIGQS